MYKNDNMTQLTLPIETSIKKDRYGFQETLNCMSEMIVQIVT